MHVISFGIQFYNMKTIILGSGYLSNNLKKKIFNSEIISTTLVFLTSGQFSLNVKPSTNTLEDLTGILFLTINFITNSFRQSP